MKIKNIYQASQNTTQKWIAWAKTSNMVDVLLILTLGLSMSLILTVFINKLPLHIEVGTVAVQDIKADQNYEIIDQRSTETLRTAASMNVLPVYDYDPSTESDISTAVQDSFQTARSFLEINRNNGHSEVMAPQAEEELKKSFFNKLGIFLTDDQYKKIRTSRFHQSLEKSILSLLNSVITSPVVHDLSDFDAAGEKGVVLRTLSPDGNFPEQIVSGSNDIVSDIENVRNTLSELTVRDFAGSWNIDFLDQDSFNLVKEMAIRLVKANTNLNNVETDERRLKARSSIKDVIIKIQSGESIIRSGDRFEQWHVTVIEGIQQNKVKGNRLVKFFGVFLFINLFLLIVYSFASKYIRKFHPNKRDLTFLGANLITFLLILRVGTFMANSLRDSLPFASSPQTLFYAIPIAAGAMLVRFILNAETAFVFAVISSLISGIFLENSLEMTVYYLIGGIFAAHSIAHIDRRSRVLISGLQTGMVNALTIFSLNLISVASYSGEAFYSTQMLSDMMAGISGGIFCALVVLAFSPAMETLFQYTTNIRLLELANLSHPLLREMIVRAPGTYHHSQIVGILSEAAAEAVGANPLLARVGSYYHDIGKMKKPQYFIENQRGGDNPHDRLAPSMSALIIEAHVKDGIEMAVHHKLPQRIADMIPQHQGTKLIGFFYNKAKKQADPAHGKIDERDYRYPGPKPQTREAGIIMLADTIEAAIRSLPEKTLGKIQTTVEKLVNQHFVDEQLDECELTLRDLHRISESFVKILIGIYHQRVEYPDEALVASSAEGAEVHYLKNPPKYENYSDQSSSSSENVSPLFRKKDIDYTQTS